MQAALRDREMTDASPFERRTRLLLRDAGLPAPRAQFHVLVSGHHHYLDFAWPEQFVGVECDSSAFHPQPHQFESDLARQNRLLGAGWLLLRCTPMVVRNQPEQIAAQVQRALATRSGPTTTEPASTTPNIRRG